MNLGKMTFQLWVTLILTTFALSASAYSKSRQENRHFAAPRFVSWTLAGARLNSNRVGAIKTLYDPQSGYYRFSSSDCFNTPRDILLCPDPSKRDARYWTPEKLKAIERGALPLKTGHRVAIGDSLRQVTLKLGQPNQIVRANNKSNEQRSIYSCNFPKAKGIWRYQAVYTFHQDRLWAIQFSRIWDTNLTLKVRR